MSDMPDGIYFDMPENDYHALPRLSSTLIKKMMISPADCWAETWMNPERQDEDDKEWQIMGRAYHAALFEPEKFAAEYVREISQSDFPADLLTTDVQIKDKLAEFGQPKTSGAGERVLDRARRLEAAGYRGPIWHLEQERWQETIGERVALKGESFDQIARDVERVGRLDRIKPHVTGGQAEVSVLWTCPATGIRMKCRFDYLKPRQFTDMKSFANKMGKNVRQAIIDAFTYDRQYVQAVLYWQCIEMVRKGEVGVAPGANPTFKQKALIDAIRNNEDPMRVWFWFQQKNGIPNMLAAELRIFDVHHSYTATSSGATEEGKATARAALTSLSIWARKAALEIEHAKKTWLQCLEVYGTSEWLPLRQEMTIGDSDFRDFWLDTVEGVDQ